MLETEAKTSFEKIKKLFNNKSLKLIVIEEEKPKAGTRCQAARAYSELKEIHIKSWVVKLYAPADLYAVFIHEIAHTTMKKSANHPLKFARACYRYTYKFFNNKIFVKNLFSKQYWWHNSRNIRADRLCKQYGIFK